MSHLWNLENKLKVVCLFQIYLLCIIKLFCCHFRSRWRLAVSAIDSRSNAHNSLMHGSFNAIVLLNV